MSEFVGQPGFSQLFIRLVIKEFLVFASFCGVKYKRKFHCSNLWQPSERLRPSTWREGWLVMYIRAGSLPRYKQQTKTQPARQPQLVLTFTRSWQGFQLVLLLFTNMLTNSLTAQIKSLVFVCFITKTLSGI